MTTQKMKRKVIFSSFVGNALEFYDFTLCGVFLHVIGQTFFPLQSSPSMSLLMGIFAFSAAFWTRPLGSLLFGYIGDRYGRKKSLTLSIALMGIPTFIIAFLPGYNHIGYAAPLLLVGCRLLQGLSTGGEYNGAAIFALEHVEGYQKGFISGVITSSCVLGAILATLSSYIVSFFPSPYAWRIPFFIGALISLVGFYLRFRIHESEEFLAFTRKYSFSKKFLLKDTLQSHKRAFLFNISLGLFNGALSYSLFGFLIIYLYNYVGVTLSTSLFYNLFGLLSFMIFCPLFGIYGDKKGPYYNLILMGTMVPLTAPLVFWCLQFGTIESVILGQVMLGILVASVAGPSHFMMQHLFPVKGRYTAIAFGFSLGMGFAGGTTQLFMKFLIDYTQSLYVPAFILTVYGIMCLCVGYGPLKTLSKLTEQKEETFPKVA